MEILRKTPIVGFYALAFLISWAGWVPQALYHYGLFPFDHFLFTALGVAGPTLAAVIMMRLMDGKDGPRALFTPFRIWRVPWRYLSFTILFWLGIGGIVWLAWARYAAILPLLAGVPMLLIGMFFSNVWEEIGWRGYALPRLQQRFGDLTIGIGMGLLWNFWHLPLYFDPTFSLASLPWSAELIFSLSLTIIYIWLYNHTQGSLLYVSLFHAMSNVVAYGLLDLGVLTVSYPMVVGVTTLLAASIVVFRGRQRF